MKTFLNVLSTLHLSGQAVYLSVLMVRTSVSLQYLTPASLISFLRAWSSRFKLDSFTLEVEMSTREIHEIVSVPVLPLRFSKRDAHNEIRARVM